MLVNRVVLFFKSMTGLRGFQFDGTTWEVLWKIGVKVLDESLLAFARRAGWSGVVPFSFRLVSFLSVISLFASKSVKVYLCQNGQYGCMMYKYIWAGMNHWLWAGIAVEGARWLRWSSVGFVLGFFGKKLVRFSNVKFYEADRVIKISNPVG